MSPTTGGGRALAVLLILGGVVAIVVAVGSVLAAVALSRTGATAPDGTFSAGQTASAPAGTGPLRGQLVVYAAGADVEGSLTRALGCDAVSARGYERVVSSPGQVDPIEVAGQELEPVASVSGWRPGDRVTCTGPQASAFEPLALGVAPAPPTATFVAVALAVVGAVMGVVLVVVGGHLLRSR